MKRPRRVQVGPHTYFVSYDAGDIAKVSVESGDQLAGHCWPSKGEIVVAPDLSPSQTRDTLLHEVLHACWSLVGLGEGKLTEERVVLALAPALLDTLDRNPKLRNYLWGTP